VDRSCRSCGVGKRLLEYVKQTHSALSLDVYQKNIRAVDFYRREGFVIVSSQADEDTGEFDFTMSWEKLQKKERISF
jgi:putative acetyltransferase